MDLKDIGINTMDLIESAQDRDYWTVLLNAAFNPRGSKVMSIVIGTEAELLTTFIG
jgi:hypothetical protein